ncbi:MAG: IS110 family transposase [Chloroflexota bacterium]|nr:IS110 family transposase [Chloroflexota bacterium]
MEPTVFIGIDIGKAFHHVIALDRDGQILLDEAVANAQAALETIFEAAVRHGTPLVCVDQPGSIGALTVAVAQAQGCPVLYLPGRRMRHVARTFAGQAKTDARDARIIAETARSMRHAVRPLTASQPLVADLRLLCGVDDDLVKQGTALKNRIRGLLTTACPVLERVVGSRLDDAGVPALLAAYPTPAALRTLGQARMARFLTRHGSRRAVALVNDVWAALAQQSVALDGTTGLGIVLPLLLEQLQAVRRQRTTVQVELARLLTDHPDSEILGSMPGFQVKTVARTVVELDGKIFGSAAQLASYAGVAPVTHQSGTSRRHHTRNRAGNKALQQAWYMAAFASLRTDRRYYDRKRQEGQRHVQALIALERRRVDVLYAMLRDRMPYTPPTPLA